MCNVASRLRNKGIEVKCPNHAGFCSANLAKDAVIRNETEFANLCTKELNDTLKIVHVTTDGDSKAYVGIKKMPNVQMSNNFVMFGILQIVYNEPYKIVRLVQQCSRVPTREI